MGELPPFFLLLLLLLLFFFSQHNANFFNAFVSPISRGSTTIFSIRRSLSTFLFLFDIDVFGRHRASSIPESYAPSRKEKHARIWPRHASPFSISPSTRFSFCIVSFEPIISRAA
jgi:hypothetical protein